MSQKTKYLVVIVGPTAIGKTTASIEIARFFNADIISADSRQFYKEMSIGTAKPTFEERKQATHHFVDFLSIKKDYNAGIFERECLELIDRLHLDNDLVVMVGGSGLYVDAVCYGLDELPGNSKTREELNAIYNEKGIEVLQKQLLSLDPDHYNKMDVQNPQRLIRAIEVCLEAGVPYSQLRRESKAERPFEIIKIGLRADREIIYDRINMRVDNMVSEGLIEEVRNLVKFKKLNALNTVGYKEVISFLEGDIESEHEAIELVKMNTRRFAKRQMTWFKKDANINWFDHTNVNEIIDYLKNYISKASK